MRTAKDFPPGTIVIPTSELGRYLDFHICLSGTAIPPGTFKSWQPGINVANNLNEALRYRQGEWCWFLGDDHAWRPDILLRLLDLNVDIVAPFCLKRELPPQTVMYRIDEASGRVLHIQLDELPTGGLVGVDAVGGAGLLVQEAVLCNMIDPWFELGKTLPDQTGEDIYFCLKAKQLGYDVLVDLDTPMGHMTPSTVWPELQADGLWGAVVQIGRKDCLRWPQEETEENHGE